MTAPNFRTVQEATSAIKKIEHNGDGSYGPPNGIAGGSGGNNNGGSTSKGIPNSTQGADYVTKRSA